MAQSLTYHIYELRYPDSGEVYYVGKENSKRSRFNDHINEVKRLNRGVKVRNPIRAGKTRKILESGSQPNFIKVFETDSEKEAFQMEKALIAKYGRINNGTGILSNLTDGGEGAYGWKHTDEAKQKISDAHTGRKISDEQKQRLSEFHTGRKHTNEAKEKISKANKGKSLSEEHKRKISEGNKGKKMSDEAKKKISESRKGEKNPMYGRSGTSDNHRAAMKKWWAERKEKENN